MQSLRAPRDGCPSGIHAGTNVELASHITGANMDWIDIVMCAKSMCARSSAGVWYSLWRLKLDTVCARLAGSGFDGLHGGAGRPALNRRTRLVQVAVGAGLVGRTDLERLHRPAPSAT